MAKFTGSKQLCLRGHFEASHVFQNEKVAKKFLKYLEKCPGDHQGNISILFGGTVIIERATEEGLRMFHLRAQGFSAGISAVLQLQRQFQAQVPVDEAQAQSHQSLTPLPVRHL